MKKIAADNNYLMFKQANCSNGQVASPLTGDCVSMHQAIDEQNRIEMEEAGMKAARQTVDSTELTTEVQKLKIEVERLNHWKNWANSKLAKI
jgi:hypothetical protein